MKELAENPNTGPFKRHVGPNLSRYHHDQQLQVPGSTPDFPGPGHHQGRSDSTGPPASSPLRFWLAERVPVRGIPRLGLRRRARGSGITSEAHSAVGRARARKARAVVVTPGLGGVLLPSAARPQVPPQPPRHSAFNWWAARPAAATSAQNPLRASST